MPEPVYLTQEGLNKLKSELEELTGNRRKELAARLRSAIQMGDLSENADYHKAKEDQAFLEGRIQELEYIVRNATIIEKGAATGKAALGSMVTVSEDGSPAETFHIVGAKEADPRKGRISNESPMGKALLGRAAGDEVRVETPAGAVLFQIIKVE